jgi:hypothetical protein
MDANLNPMIEIENHPVFYCEIPENPDDPGEYVYHYTKWERLLDIMNSGFRLSELAYMNDPRESKDWFLHTVSHKPGTSVDRHALNEAVADYRRKLRIGAFCLDQPSSPDGDPSQRGYARPRMWAQYGENHGGVCIVLRRERLDQAIRGKHPDRDGSWVRDGRVKYITTQGEPTNLAMEYREDYIKAGVDDYLTANADKIFFVKHVDWRDENEYRWAYFDANQSATAGGMRGPFVDINGSVAALVLGQDYKDSHLPVARMFAEYYHLDGNIVRCLWNRLSLYLVPFADDGGSFIPVDNGPRAFDFIVGPVRTQPYTPPQT